LCELQDLLAEGGSAVSWKRDALGNLPASGGVLIGVRVDPAFDAFVEAHSSRLLRVAYLLTGDRGHAEDLLQTALLRTLRHWSAAREAPIEYVRRVLINLSRDRVRLLNRRPRESPLPADPDTLRGHGPDAAVESLGERRRVADAIGVLPTRQRQVVILRFFEDLSVAQTAELLGFSDGTVKAYTSRALDRLRALLTEPEVKHAPR
jgi:RNA polymerase sigma-70 factor (sigma-E family)